MELIEALHSARYCAEARPQLCGPVASGLARDPVAWMLRDVTIDQAIEAATTPEELITAWPDILK